jgi:hypothetical protein
MRATAPARVPDRADIAYARGADGRVDERSLAPRHFVAHCGTILAYA